MRVSEKSSPVPVDPTTAPKASAVATRAAVAANRWRLGVRLGGATAIIGLGVGVGLTACTPAETVKPAPSATNTTCAEVMLGLPQELAGLKKRKTTSQATAAWGDPAQVILRCGTKAPGPTNDPCTTVDGVDWVAHQVEGSKWRLTAYGRVPGIEVTLDNKQVSSSDVAQGLTEAARHAPATKKCKEAPKE